MGTCAGAAVCPSPRCSFPERAAEVCGQTGRPTAVADAASEGPPPLLRLWSGAGAAEAGQPPGAGSLEGTCRDTARQNGHSHPWGTLAPEDAAAAPRDSESDPFRGSQGLPPKAPLAAGTLGEPDKTPGSLPSWGQPPEVAPSRAPLTSATS